MSAVHKFPPLCLSHLFSVCPFAAFQMASSLQMLISPNKPRQRAQVGACHRQNRKPAVLDFCRSRRNTQHLLRGCGRQLYASVSTSVCGDWKGCVGEKAKGHHGQVCENLKLWLLAKTCIVWDSWSIFRQSLVLISWRSLENLYWSV